MPEFKYAVLGLDPEKTAKSSGRDMRISPKDAREVCYAINGLMLTDAKTYLDGVMEEKVRVPLKRHDKHIAHSRGIRKWYVGRFPVNAAKAIRNVLVNAEANAEFKGLDVDRLRIIHSAAHRARKLRKYIPRARGRATPYFKPLSHVEIVIEEE